MKTRRVRYRIALVLFLAESLWSQVPMEPRASLQADVERAPYTWFEGYARILKGTPAPYESHRSGGSRDSALVIRTNEVDQSIEWQTELVPLATKGETNHFLWTCGFGSNQGEEAFELIVNGRYRFSFVTSKDPEWSVMGRDGGRLSFTLMGFSQYGASLGYMTLEAPSSWLRRDIQSEVSTGDLMKRGVSLSLQLKPRSGNTEVWYRLYQYQHSLRYFLTQESLPLYFSWQHINFGDAILALVTQSNLAGATVHINTPTGELANSVMVRSGNIAHAEIQFTRTQERLLKPPIVVQVGTEIVDTISKPDLEERRIKAFMEEEIVFERYFFPPGTFPSAAWKNPVRVRNLIGTADLKITFFNSSFEKVQTAEKPGRYGAVVECTTSSGFDVCRFVTLFCIPTSLDNWVKGLSSSNVSAKSGFETAYQREEMGKYLAGKSSNDITGNPEAAIFFAGVPPMNSGEQENDSPHIRDRQWWIDFKRTVLGNAQSPVQLHSPRVESDPRGPILKELDPIKCGYRAEDIAVIRKICTSWSEEGGEPNVTIMVHDGNILFYEAFGKDGEGKSVTRTTPMLMASITKLLTGTLMMQFVDQGLIELDAPVSKYLPELPKSGSPVLTVRDLFTHTNGFGWHGEWASDWNMSLENYLAQCLPVCRVREKHQYNRMGYAVAGKIMERLTGKSVPVLFYENLLQPLGMKNTFVDNTYGSCVAAAYDIALVGQMLLNKGEMDGMKFFSEGTFERMLPQKMAGPKGKLEPDWGIGTAWLGGNGLSEKTFGHEAASGAILRIDPELRLVLVSARDRIGRNYALYESFKNQLLSAVATAVRNRQDMH